MAIPAELEGMSSDEAGAQFDRLFPHDINNDLSE